MMRLASARLARVVESGFNWKEIIPGGVARLQIWMVPPCVAGWVRLPFPSANHAVRNVS
jgi:hypothetical protein